MHAKLPSLCVASAAAQLFCCPYVSRLLQEVIKRCARSRLRRVALAAATALLPPPPPLMPTSFPPCSLAAMYPTINLVGDNTFNPLHAPYPSPGSSSSAPPPQPPAPPQQGRANGPPGGPPPPAFPTLQVAIDPKFCLAPPVRCIACKRHSLVRLPRLAVCGCLVVQPCS